MKRILLLILCVIMAASSVSCKKPDSSAAREIAQPLIEASQVLDALLYGEGLERSEDEKTGKYARVISDKYTSIQVIKDEMALIYTPELCEIVINSTLKGSTNEHGTNYARYIDLDGVMYMYENAKVYVPHPRKYDFDSLVAKDMTDLRLIVEINTYSADADGNYSDTPEKVELKFLYDEGLSKWLLDTPTY